MEQDRYQIRFDWGVDGASAVGVGADVLVWVDAVPGDAVFDPASVKANGAVVAGDFASAGAVAQWIVDRQKQLAKRITIAVVGAGAARSTGYRFAVEDLLAAARSSVRSASWVLTRHLLRPPLRRPPTSDSVVVSHTWSAPACRSRRRAQPAPRSSAASIRASARTTSECFDQEPEFSSAVKSRASEFMQ